MSAPWLGRAAHEGRGRPCLPEKETLTGKDLLCVLLISNDDARRRDLGLSVGAKCETIIILNQGSSTDSVYVMSIAHPPASTISSNKDVDDAPQAH